MSINTTPNLHLPQWTAEEQPKFLTEFNQAFGDIDSGYGAVNSTAATAIATAGAAETAANNAVATVNALSPRIITLENEMAAVNNRDADSRVVATTTLDITPTSLLTTTENSKTNYNYYTGYININAKFSGTALASGSNTIGTITNLPYAIKELWGYTGIETTNGLYMCKLVIASSGAIILAVSSNVTPASAALNRFTLSFPIFKASASQRISDDIPEGCAIIR